MASDEVFAYVKQAISPEVGHFLAPGIFGRDSLGDTSYPISSSRPCGFRQEDLFMFLQYISLCKSCDAGEGPFFASGA